MFINIGKELPNYPMIKTKLSNWRNQNLFTGWLLYFLLFAPGKNVIRSFLLPSFAKYKDLQFIFLQKIISNPCLVYEKDIEKEMTLFLFKTICMCGLCNVQRFVRKNRRMSSKSSRVLLHSCKYLRKIRIYIFSFQLKEVK